MPTRTKVGLSLLVVCGLVALVNGWAFRTYPEDWGGPNIGGGFIQLLAYAGLIVGAALLVTAIAGRRRNRGPSKR